MSRFFSTRYSELTPYVPGEQPKERILLKLNTNESPWAPVPGVAEAVAAEAGKLRLYSDPDCTLLREKLSGVLNVSPGELLMTNGSDEILNFAFMAYCDEGTPAIFADLTYGFYPVFAGINRVPYREIPLGEHLELCPEDYFDAEGTIFIANPNAPTGRSLPRTEIRRILDRNRHHIVVVDEAYVDFGGESSVPLIREYDNLLVTRTFSKSRSLAGLRLGFGVACEALIQDLKTIQYSTNPYNVDRLAQAAGIACLEADEYNAANNAAIVAIRDRAAMEMRKMGFEVTESRTNFLFARHPKLPGETLARALRQRGILIRHFSVPRIRDWNRITVGTEEQMALLMAAIREILTEEQG